MIVLLYLRTTDVHVYPALQFGLNLATHVRIPPPPLLLFQNKIVPVTGFLHLTDIKRPYALEGTPGAKDCEVEVKKGIHLTAYVKDVFPNAGRMTLSLDPNINKDKVQ